LLSSLLTGTPLFPSLAFLSFQLHLIQQNGQLACRLNTLTSNRARRVLPYIRGALLLATPVASTLYLQANSARPL
jgi:hypothetical protein